LTDPPECPYFYPLSPPATLTRGDLDATGQVLAGDARSECRVETVESHPNRRHSVEGFPNSVPD
jgi:hypothetical protein